MPIIKCAGSPERWRIGSGECVFTSFENAKRAYIAYLASNPREVENAISFDYDGVLDTERYKRLARTFINQGKTVYIITGRSRLLGNSVYRVAEQLGIPRDNVIFTNGRDKLEFVRRYRIRTFYDNNPDQVKMVEENTNALAILV